MFSATLLQDKVVLITGASRGIGKGIAAACGAQGATVIGTATTEKGAEQITADLTASGIKGRGMVLDVRDAASVEALFFRRPAPFRPAEDTRRRQPYALLRCRRRHRPPRVRCSCC